MPFTERLLVQQERSSITLWPCWYHPFFGSFAEVDWRGKFEKEGDLILPWGGREVVRIKRKFFPEFGGSYYLLAEVDSWVAFGKIREEFILRKFPEWQAEKNDGWEFCLKVREECEKRGLSEIGIVVVSLSLYFPRHGWNPFGLR